jgi:hypothetical protein
MGAGCGATSLLSTFEVFAFSRAASKSVFFSPSEGSVALVRKFEPSVPEIGSIFSNSLNDDGIRTYSQNNYKN